MMHVKKWMLCMAAGALAALCAVPVYGASRKSINSITLTIKANIVPGTMYGEEEIQIDSKSNRFSVDGYTVLNEENEWHEDTVPKIRISLTADSDYYFISLPKDKITLKGGAEYISSQRQDNYSTLLMDVKLPDLQNAIRGLENVVLSEDGIASWNPISAAGSYEVRVYRDGKAVGSSLTAYTNTCNCREKLTKGDTSYIVKVRPVSKFEKDEKGEWMESAGTYISPEKAAQFRENPTAASREWIRSAENGRWWYRRADATYPAAGWENIGGKWYYFDAEGYMMTGWIHWEDKDYYCSEDGGMLTDCITPDAYWVGADGARINQ